VTGRARRFATFIHFDDGGAGRRYFDCALDAGSEVRDGDRRYEVERVEQATHVDGASTRDQ
jgi:hypothetical protein